MSQINDTVIASDTEQLTKELEMLAATGQVNPALLANLADELSNKSADPDDEADDDDELETDDEDEKRKRRRKSRGGNITASLVSVTGRRNWSAGKIVTPLLMLRDVGVIKFDEAEVSQLLIKGDSVREITFDEVSASLGVTIQAPNAILAVEDSLVCADTTTIVVQELILEEGAVIGSALAHPFRIVAKRLEVKGPISVLNPRMLDIAVEQAAFDEDIKETAAIRKAVTVDTASAMYADYFAAPNNRTARNQVSVVSTPAEVKARREKEAEKKRKRDGEDDDTDTSGSTDKKAKDPKAKKKDKHPDTTPQDGVLILKAEEGNPLIRIDSSAEIVDQPDSTAEGTVVVLSEEDQK